MRLSSTPVRLAHDHAQRLCSSARLGWTFGTWQHGARMGKRASRSCSRRNTGTSDCPPSEMWCQTFYASRANVVWRRRSPAKFFSELHAIRHTILMVDCTVFPTRF